MSPTGDPPAEGFGRRGIQLGLLLSALLLPLCFALPPDATATAAGPSPTPEPDPLAIPVLPEHPTEVDLGREIYYYHCMPCHGDKGQGLTDEWRGVWDEDHQNCWSRGCHGGRIEDQGFPIPHSIPPVMPPFATLTGFSSVKELAAFLHTNHPPQSPGVLDEAECESLAAYLTQQGRQTPTAATDGTLGAEGPASAGSAEVVRAAVALAATLGLAWLIGSREPH